MPRNDSEPPEPIVGRYYNIELGNGSSKVIDLERNDDGDWTRVRLEFVSGCMPCPPDDRPDAPADEWELPIARKWLTRDEWEQRALWASLFGGLGPHPES